MIYLGCSQYIVIIVISILLVSDNCLEVSPAVAVLGGEAYMRWTVNTSTEGIRIVYGPHNNSIMTFLNTQHEPIKVAQNVNYTGNISQGIMSFTVNGVTLANVGKFKYILPGSIENGGQDLVIAESPNITGIIELFPPAVSGGVSRLNCNAVSTSIPSSHNLTMMSEWKKNGINITMGSKYSINGTTLVVNKLDRTDNQNNFTCRAYEDLRRKSEESDAFSLNVFYGPENAQIIPAGELNVDEGRSVNMTCFAECNPPCSNFSWQKSSNQTVVGNVGSLVIGSVKREDAGVYICNVTNSQIVNSTMTQKNVSINYGPDNPLLLSPSNTSYRVVENSTIPTISCTSPCFPSCDFQWTGPVTSLSEVISLGTVNRSEMGNYTCKGRNPKTNIDVISVVTVFVIYGPDTSVIVPNTTVYRLNEGDTLPSIQCSADCFPNCTSHWYNGTTPVPGSPADMLILGKVYRNETGNYTCRSENTENKAEAESTLQLVVQYGPDYPLQLFPSNTSYRVVENSTIPSITCTSPCFPSCDFQWTGPVTSSSGVISLGTVNRSEIGNYTCKGRNHKTNITLNSVVTVFVIYGPDTPVVVPNTTEYRLNEGDFLPSIQCSADCFPNCTSHWYNGTTPVPGSPADMLILGKVYRNETGNYTCRSENTERKAKAESTLQLVVQYPPTVTIVGKNGSHNDNGLMINCSAHGVPEQYTYKLTHLSLFSEIEIRQLNYMPISTGVIVHEFTNLSFMDTGIYRCNVSNGIRDYRDGSLDQSFSVTLQIKGAPYRASNELIFYAAKGHSSRLWVEFYNSGLDAQVMWYRLQNKTTTYLQSSDKYNFTVSETMVNVTFYSVRIEQRGLMAALDITNVTEEDFTSYKVHVGNDTGAISLVTLELKPKGPPDVPQNVHIVQGTITTSSVGIGWVSGFHGGLSQTFVIEYRRPMDESWTKFPNEIFGGMSQNNDLNITVTGLDHETLYLFRMYSWNTYKKSEYSAVMNATTYAETEATSFPIGVVAGSISGAMVAGVGVIFVLIFLRRRGQRSKRRDDVLSTDLKEMERPKSGLVDNPVYDSSEPAQSLSANSGTARTEYAVVVKKKGVLVENTSNIYAQVDKQKEKKKNGAAKGKQARGDIYENADVVGRSPSKENVYANSDNVKTEPSGDNVYENPGADASPLPMANKDGLLYADLMLDPPTTKYGKPVIRGIENRTEYAEIAYGKRGKPLPDIDEAKGKN